jgi:hypothetical protein
MKLVIGGKVVHNSLIKLRIVIAFFLFQISLRLLLQSIKLVFPK